METAYRIKVGKTYFYSHAQCHIAKIKENPNNLTPEQQRAIELAFKEVYLSDVPEDAVCSILGCHKSIHQGA